MTAPRELTERGRSRIAKWSLVFMVGMLLLVLVGRLYVRRFGTTARHMSSVYLIGDMVRLTQAEAAFHAAHGRYTTNVDSLSALVAFRTDTFVDWRFEVADSVQWRAVASPRRFDYSCAVTGNAGQPLPTYEELHPRCVQY